jgi:hypothetical protein
MSDPSPDSPDLQQRLEALEAEIRQNTSQNQSSQQPPQTEWLPPETTPTTGRRSQFGVMIQSAKIWFDRLPVVAKVGAIALGIMLGLALLNTVVKLLALAIILVFLGAAGYFGYKVLQSKDNDRLGS